MTSTEIATELDACAPDALRQLRERFEWARAELGDCTPADMRQWLTGLGWSRGATPWGVLIFDHSARDPATGRSAVVATRYVRVELLGGGACDVSKYREDAA